MSDPTEASVNEFGPLPPEPDRPRHTGVEDAKVRDFLVEAARLMSDLHCDDIVAFDVRGFSDVTDYIVIASGTSDRQIRSVADEVSKLAREYGLDKFGRESDGPSTWIVLDLVEVLVHLFEPNARAHYDLEMMWGDAPTIQWKR